MGKCLTQMDNSKASVNKNAIAPRFMDLQAPNLARRSGAGMKNTSQKRNNKIQMVAMETRKFSHGPGIGLIVPNLLWYNLLPHSDFPAENERNLPRGFRDRPIATGTATRFRLRLS